MAIDRRTCLGVLASGVAATTAGCTGLFGGGDPNPNVVLDEPDPELYRGLSIEQRRKRGYPVWGGRVPEVSVPAPLDDRTVDLRSPSKPALVTFFYTSCKTFCPRLVSALANVQDHAGSNGYAGEIRLLPITFDPQRDDAEKLRAYAGRMNVDADAPNWSFLRPESKARANAVVGEEFGIRFQRSEKVDSRQGYGFVHPGVILLVNTDGYVERAYRIGRESGPPIDRMLSDLETVRNA